MADDQKVNCSIHGSSEAALVCSHLASGAKRIGFNYAYSDDQPDALCPEAWCHGCDEVLVREDGWTDKAFDHADFKVICASCFSRIRSDNWQQDQAAYEEFVGQCCTELAQKQDALVTEFKLGEHSRFDYDQDRAELVFSNDGKVAVVCDIAFVGSFSTNSDTWMWSWANSSNTESVKARMREVRTFGEQKGFERLAGAYWPATAEDGWHMTGVAAHLLKARGVYRCPSDYGFLYMVILGARWVQ